MTNNVLRAEFESKIAANDQEPQVFRRKGNRRMRDRNIQIKSALPLAVALFTVTLAWGLFAANRMGSQPAVPKRESADASAKGVSLDNSPKPTTGLSMGFAMADFTGDTHPDSATVEFNGFDSARAQYVVEIRLSEGGYQFLPLTAPFGGLLITPKDVTGDGNLDLIVRDAKSQVPVAVFLNDGSGHFSPAAEPGSFVRALPEAPSGFRFTTERMRFDSMFVSPTSCAAEHQSGSASKPQAKDASILPVNNGAPSHSAPLFGLNRAPPSVA